MRTTITFILAALFAGTAWAAQPTGEGGKGLSLGTLSETEISFLTNVAPTINHVVSSGAVIVYGRAIEPPILVTMLEDRIYLDGIQVNPKMARPHNFLAKQRVDQIHEQYFLGRKAHGQAAAEAAVRNGATELMSDRPASRTEFTKGKATGLQVKVAVDNEEWHYHLDASCPSSLLEKYLFMIRTIIRAYSLRSDEQGKSLALEWLHARFGELKTMGVLASYQFMDDDGPCPGSCGNSPAQPPADA